MIQYCQALTLGLALLLRLNLTFALGLLLLACLLLLLCVILAFLLFVPVAVARLAHGFDRAIQRSQLIGRGRAWLRPAATRSRCPRVHCAGLFTDHAHLLCGLVGAIRQLMY